MGYEFEKSGKIKEPTDAELAAADADPNTIIIVLDRGVTGRGDPYWAYIAVKPSKYKALMQGMSQRQRVQLNDYGAILKYGFEKEVPPEIKDEMKRQYGCDDNFLATVTQKVQIAQTAFLKQQEAQRIGDIVAMLKKNQGG